jgi:hypothetical protein
MIHRFGFIELEEVFGKLLFGVELVFVNLELWTKEKRFGMALYYGVVRVESGNVLKRLRETHMKQSLGIGLL